MKQEAPFSVQVEATEGCNLRCPFCGINAITEPKQNCYNFMSPETAVILARQIEAAGWNPRLEFGMHGEPTMNPELPKIAHLLRSYLPKAYLLLYTNAGGLFFKPGPKVRIEQLFDCGFNTIMVEDYGHTTFGERIRKLDIEKLEYPADKSANPQARHSGQKLIIVADISHAASGTHSTLNNHGGNASPPEDRLRGQRCAKVFREISVRWDGHIAICCNDWQGEYKCGDIHQTPIDEIWQHQTFDAARAKLYAGQRDFGPCDGCTQRSYRVGLLPDKMGKLNYRKPTQDDESIVEAALSGRSYTPGVKP